MLQTLKINDIKINAGTQSREMCNGDVVVEYFNLMSDGVQFPPMKVVFDGANYYLVDGFHRYFAYRKGMTVEVECEVIEGTLRDAVFLSLGVNNSHGLRRSNADKRKAVLTMLRDEEWKNWSNVKIAEACNVSNTFVLFARREYEAEINTVQLNEQPYTSNIRSIEPASESQRTYIHPKTGNPTTMNTRNIGKTRYISVDESTGEIIAETDEQTLMTVGPTSESEIDDLKNDLQNCLLYYRTSTNTLTKEILRSIDSIINQY